MNSKNIKYVVGACLVGMVVTSCQSWKFRGFQFPIVLRSPIDWENFKNKKQAEAEPQHPQHEEERAEAAAIERPEIQEVKPEGANAEPPKVEKKPSRSKDKEEAKPVVNKGGRTVGNGVSKKKGQNKKSQSVKKKSVKPTGDAPKPAPKSSKKVIIAPAW